MTGFAGDATLTQEGAVAQKRVKTLCEVFMLKSQARAIRITISANPVAKGRPRVAFKNGRTWSYTPHKTQAAQEDIVKRLVKYQHRCFGRHVPVKASVCFYRIKSKWLPKQEALPVRKPDLDNFLKLVLDSLNGVLVEDDAQITSMTVKKRWAGNGKRQGCITVRLEEDRYDKGKD